MKYFLILFVVYGFVYTHTFAQIDRETRAVWLATNFRLDWPPPTYDQQFQRQALVKIFDEIEKQNLNTIYFQVRFNGTVLFNSEYEPWSYYLSGEVNGQPEYDPLKFAINEAHKRGLEIHAWFNMLKCFDGMEQQVFEHPEHVMNKHTNWVHKVTIDDKATYWLDPGLPEVQNYLAEVVVDLANKYDVDGIHLDYIRYPSRSIDDSFSYAAYGNQLEIHQWRRDNITSIVRNIKEQVDEINPYIKIGAAPIGIYKNKPNATGMQAYSEIYQESRSWLKEGLVDYLAPQIYWNMNDNPKFALVVDDWINESNNKNIIVGIASYKDDVKRETPQMIEIARKSGAKGIAFFRYTFIERNTPYFDSKALPAEMKWKPKLNPIPPQSLAATISKGDRNIISLSWQLSETLLNRYDVNYFAIFDLQNSSSATTSNNLIKVLPSATSKLSFSLKKPTKLNYFYTVRSLDRYWNESLSQSEVTEVTIPALQLLYDKISYHEKPLFIEQSGRKFLIINSNSVEVVNIEGLDEIASELLSTSMLAKGVNVIELQQVIDKFNSLKIIFNHSGREVKLNLN